MIRYLVRLALIDARHGAVRAGYWIRPYDMRADARVWRWRRRPCRPVVIDADGHLYAARWTR